MAQDLIPIQVSSSKIKIRDFHRGNFEVKVSYKHNGYPVCLARDTSLSRAETKARWILMEHLTIAQGEPEPWRISSEYDISFTEVDISDLKNFKPSDCFMGDNYQVEVLVK